ncbi:hypothetical protein [Cupriavidus sp. UYPR2.512]|uniref:hypothetical protein n=1 Tax=Cupriavidus sp. UYPR2.512 TaxID=1080187 RepID=UPI0012FA6B00|nr:hypothetical protein [Cupriavidus sp. UYPR2.512]UIF90890.1 hypothetical protein KAF44_32395 [Cupriavidus necator]
MNAPMTHSTLKPASSIDWPADAVPETWVNSLFEKMSAMYGSKFADMWRGTDLTTVRRLWGVELAQLSREELRQGVAALKSVDAPPTLPRFLKICRPQVDYDSALYEAAQQLRLRAEGRDEWTNPAFYWAAIKVGEFEMLNSSRDSLIKRFTAALDSVLAGGVQPVPPRLVALPAPGQTRADPERVKAAVEQVRATTRVPGNKLWAQRILDRQKAGEKLAFMTAKMARSALGMADPAHA